ncbi:RICIN domain-containing protein [Reichenbachiella agariperforans]|nr:RICIN domain-containing protein [Reichenbachiella agariperforans]
MINKQNRRWNLGGFSVLLIAAILIFSCSENELLESEELSIVSPEMATPNVGTKYYLKNRKSGRYLDVENKSNTNGANIQQWGTSSGTSDTHRQWEILSTSDGYVRLKGVDSGKSIEVSGGSNANGANVQQWAYQGTTHQQWQILSTGDGYYRLKNRDSGKSMGVAGGSTSNGGNVESRAWDGSTKFQWLFEEVGGSSGGGVPGGTASVPSDLMDNCNQWKITYPNGVEDKTLCGESNNEYFYVNSAKNGIVFRTPIRSNNGTTPNSDYVRSELRERKTDGSSDVYWTTSGNHMVYVKQAITHLPINKDHLVATQIHGNKDDGIDDAMVLRLEGSHLFLSFNGGDLRSDLTIKTNYTLGTVHEVIFEVINGKHYCYYSENGNLASAYENGNASSYLVKDGSNSYVMNRSYDDAYFKIGNYTQSNAEKEGSDTGSSNNYGEVVVYDFFVEH